MTTKRRLTAAGVAAVAASVLLLPASAARADVLTVDGTPGTYGTPYGYLGANNAKYWEQYRKGFDQFDAPYPSVVGANSGPTSAIYSNVRQGCDPSFQDCVFRAPGVFVGPAGTTIAPAHRFQLIETATAPNQFDLRLAFAEHNAAGGGGAPFGTFVSSHGGDNGTFQDLFYGNWGVDGVYMGFNVSHANPTWNVGLGRASQVAAAAAGDETTRANFNAAVTVAGGSGAPNAVDTGIPTSVPLSLDWSLSGNTLQAVFGEAVTFTWAFDADNPGNTDGVDYQNGSFDPANVVPVLFDGWAAFNVTPDQPATTQELGIGPVPEPAALGLLALALPSVLLRRPRR